MLADPQTVTVNAVAIPLPRTSQGPTVNEYTSADGKTKLTTKQNITSKRFRREARLAQTKIAADPISAVNSEAGFSFYVVIDEPRSGVFTDTEIGYVIAALKTWLDSTTYNKILGGEF